VFRLENQAAYKEAAGGHIVQFLRIVQGLSLYFSLQINRHDPLWETFPTFAVQIMCLMRRQGSQFHARQRVRHFAADGHCNAAKGNRAISLEGDFRFMRHTAPATMNGLP
jgi:hypothetical protein